MPHFNKRILFILFLSFVLAGVASFIGLNDVRSFPSGEVYIECSDYGDDWLEPYCRIDGYTASIRGVLYTDVWDYFEGDDGTTIDDLETQYEWESVGLTGTNKAEVDSGYDYEGDCSIYLARNEAEASIYMRYDYELTSNDYSYVWLRKSDLGDIRIVWGNGNGYQIYIVIDQNEDVQYRTGPSTYIDTGINVNDDTWFNLIIKPTWASHVFECWIDGSLAIFGGSMYYSNSPYFTIIEIDIGGECWVDEYYRFSSETSAGGEGGWYELIEALEKDNIYALKSFGFKDGGLTIDEIGFSDTEFCKTAGSAPFPVWLILVLVAVVGLGIYTKSLILSIAGVVLCIVSYSWVLNNPNADDVGVMGGAAFFLILIAWIILNLIYREHRNG